MRTLWLKVDTTGAEIMAPGSLHQTFGNNLVKVHFVFIGINEIQTCLFS